MAKPEKLTTAECLAVPCDVCNAKVGEKCTAPTDAGRRAVEWFHFRREQDAVQRLEQIKKEEEQEP